MMVQAKWVVRHPSAEGHHERTPDHHGRHFRERNQIYGNPARPAHPEPVEGRAPE